MAKGHRYDERRGDRRRGPYRTAGLVNNAGPACAPESAGVPAPFARAFAFARAWSSGLTNHGPAPFEHALAFAYGLVFAHQRRDACLEMAMIQKLGCPEVLASLRLNADRIAAMLTGLVRREPRQVEASA